ncbi:MAG: 50S ribosomal protein L30 [Candidatus Cloacimonadaceae bacterium]|jgi:large subunit ribosomal protein L30|nr:50S ribosomal protein L30 [Candidatus Cloacimonadota bacterium]MDD3523306.1 50S ribosomal protein L30 [Candidatus Cloacimonadota bacterium]MDY0319189.1 50S ribosomal protein L30 [Candidatus Cloacimonadaceae bacterium]
MKKIKVTLIRSTINRIEAHKRVVKSLGLNKMNSSRIHDDSPAIRGMINKVSYLVKVEEVQGD